MAPLETRRILGQVIAVGSAQQRAQIGPIRRADDIGAPRDPGDRWREPPWKGTDFVPRNLLFDANDFLPRLPFRRLVRLRFHEAPLFADQHAAAHGAGLDCRLVRRAAETQRLSPHFAQGLPLGRAGTETRRPLIGLQLGRLDIDLPQLEGADTLLRPLPQRRQNLE